MLDVRIWCQVRFQICLTDICHLTTLTPRLYGLIFTPAENRKPSSRPLFKKTGT